MSRVDACTIALLAATAAVAALGHWALRRIDHADWRLDHQGEAGE